MELQRIREVNEKILEKATDKSLIALESSDFDKECFEVMSQALDNILDINKIEKTHIRDTPLELTRMDPKVVTTDFEQTVYDIVEKRKGDAVAIEKVIEIVAETMEDMKILNNRMYTATMNKLKSMLV